MDGNRNIILLQDFFEIGDDLSFLFAAGKALRGNLDDPVHMFQKTLLIDGIVIFLVHFSPPLGKNPSLSPLPYDLAFEVYCKGKGETRKILDLASETV
jgi:hypothetical protein